MSKEEEVDFSSLLDELASNGSANAHGTLALIFLFGLPDRAGRLELPHGIPRDIDRALDHIAVGLAVSVEERCALCFTLLGFLLSLGHPGAQRRARAWLGGPGGPPTPVALEDNIGPDDVVPDQACTAQPSEPRVPLHEVKAHWLGEEGRWGLHEEQAALHLVEDRKEVEEEGMRATEAQVVEGTCSAISDDVSQADPVALAYILGSKHGDTLATFAFAFNALHGAIQANLRQRTGAGPLWLRPLRQEVEQRLCVDFVGKIRQAVLRSTQHAENNHNRDWGHRPLKESGPMKRSKAWADSLWQRKAGGDPKAAYGLAELLASGGESVQRNLTTAREYFNVSARSGFIGGHWGLFLMQMRGQIEDTPVHIDALLRGAHGDEHEAKRKAMVRYYAHRKGLAGFDKDPARAGDALREAAELGDSNAQLMVAFAFRGQEEINAQPLLHGVEVGPPNRTEEIRLLEMAAASGRIVAKTHVAMRYGERVETGGCARCYETFRHVGPTYDPLGAEIFRSARLAHDRGDLQGAALRMLLLAEAGSDAAMRAAAEVAFELGGRGTNRSVDDDLSQWACGGGGWMRCAYLVHLRLVAIGDTESLNQVSAALRTGWGGAVHRDAIEGRRLTQLAAARGDPRGLLEAALDDLCGSEDDPPRALSADAARAHLHRLEGMEGIGSAVPWLATVGKAMSYAPALTCVLTGRSSELVSTVLVFSMVCLLVVALALTARRL